MLKTARGIQHDLRDMIADAERLTHLKPPADEPASNAYNALLTGSGGQAGAFGYGLGHIQREHGYISELINRLEDALNITHAGDEDAASAVNGASSADDGLA
ncbi:hypothetical protein GCM10022222_69120 [Amycolatopsis ultiminotia]|uniref:Excreted virulence factor EspC, type VII ESX diderm n=1 Tax=Amycolatopsis ultiminotia TaxID=543629 RepID=A0ABP6Y1L3_9PSEU